MSENVSVTGVFQKVPLGEFKTYEELAQHICKVNNVEFEEGYHKSYMEALREEIGMEELKGFIILNNEIYVIDKKEDDTYFTEVLQVGGKFFFATCFYNGGTCLEEELEEILKNGKQRKL